MFHVTHSSPVYVASPSNNLEAKEHLEKKGSNAGGSSVNAVLQSHLSPVYPSLPKNAVQYHCKSVYDGDTLTLEDGKKVRLLGIDTPEIKEKQPFALEAKEYTKKYCHGKDIWLTFEQPGGAEDDKNKDHYGRILAFVWVPAGDTVNSDAGGGGKRSRQNSNSSQWICVNEGLIASGLAHSYSPSKTKKVHNHDKMLGLQKRAREKRLGQWRGYRDYDAIVTPSGSAFHKCKGKKSTESDCKYLARSKSLSLISASEAYDKGLHPCRNCFG